MMAKIEGIIFDWAGTTIDYGCFAPLNVFLEVFKKRGVDITLEEAREPMGMLKIEHIRTLTEMPRVRNEWITKTGKAPTEQDVIEMNDDFERTLIKILPDFTTPIPGVIETIQALRDRGLKIGSTTGYTKEMIEIVYPRAKEKGYSPDFYIASDEVKSGRPYPWMCYQNAMELEVYPMNRLVKVGDTKIDMEEGRNAGMWAIGIVLGSSTLGLSEEEVRGLDPAMLEEKMKTVRKKLFDAGAHYVIDSIRELVSVVEEIEKKELVEL
ncbi:phosphonoacetaldehyde hydrolase [Neobacillus kokaensis]|uniref:Phosphonoacetaldehyde hydrolase n=2 Tax=Neobacillus kokaensis TaxID=2759023 RepID=A0ABQ3N9Y0_9BACI|nr:phosphonoacetaldehyde hydrolase [Neobacillus kokaensis]